MQDCGIIDIKWVIDLNISSIASAASSLDSIGVKYAASLKVMEMAQDVYEEAAAELLSAMDALITGLGQYIDITI